MRYYWYFVVSIILLSVILFAFFGASLRFENSITYTDDVITAPSITFIDPSIGSPTADVTIVAYGDYACDGCAELDETLLTLLADDFPDDIRIIWKDMPNTSQHPEALNAAVAARCAGDQGKFWEYHTLLMKNHLALSPVAYAAFAEELTLNTKTFSSCFTDQTPAPMIQKTYEEGIALNVSATPTIFVNGTRYTGAIDYGTLKAMIRQIIAQT
jgi:protein-disulfide isomerase